MNKLYYPSLKLCEKLTEIGFPETQMVYWDYWILDATGDTAWYQWETWYKCPSIMEMLSIMPSEVIIWNEDEADSYDLEFSKIWDNKYWVAYTMKWWIDESIEERYDTFPNALAGIIIWLIESELIYLK